LEFSQETRIAVLKLKQYRYKKENRMRKTSRREFTGQVVAGAAMVGIVPFLAGCPTATIDQVLNELNTWVPAAIATFDGVLSIINPAAGTALALLQKTIDGEWQALSGAISTYIHTVPPPANGLPQIIAFMSALQANLSQVIAALPPGLDQTILASSKAAFALLLATLIDIENRLQPSTPAIRAAAINSVLLPQPAKSTADFVKQINAIMAKNGQSLRVK
jgi:hypothetical protein